MLAEFLRRLSEGKAVTMTVHAKPGAPETVVTGELADGTLKIAVHAPSEKGKANAELRRFLAEQFRVPMQNVDILSGAGVRRKLIRVLPSATLQP